VFLIMAAISVAFGIRWIQVADPRFYSLFSREDVTPHGSIFYVKFRADCLETKTSRKLEFEIPANSTPRDVAMTLRAAANELERWSNDKDYLFVPANQ